MVMTPRQFLDLIERQADALDRFEEAVRERAAKPMDTAFTRLVRDAARDWAILQRSLEQNDRAALQQLIDLLAVMRRAVPNLETDAHAALDMGAQQGMAAAEIDSNRLHISEMLPSAIQDLMAAMRTAVDDKISKARAYLMAGTVDWPRLITAVAIAGRAVQSVKLTASQIAVRGVAEGQRTAMRLLGMRLIWRSELDACPICLAYTGEVSNTDGFFRGGLTFGDTASSSPGELVVPPAHPNCHCSVAVYSPRKDPDGLVPTALKRAGAEAVRRGSSRVSLPG